MNYKIRWYLENSLAIIYWSIAFISLFFSIIFILEKASIHWKSFIFLFLFLVLIYLSRKRWLIFTDEGIKITHAQFWKNQFYDYSQIEEIYFTDSMIQITIANKKFDYRIKRKEILPLYYELKQFVPNTLVEIQQVNERDA